MILIIGHHLAAHGIMHSYSTVLESQSEKLSLWVNGFKINKVFISLLLPGGEVGVAIFFMLSGYFLINNVKRVKWYRLIYEGFFYSIFSAIIVGIAIVAGFRPSLMNITTMLKSSIETVVTPYNGWWFLGTYILIIALLPVIQKMCLKYNRKKSLRAIFLLWLFVYCLNLLFESGYGNLSKGFFFFILGGFIRNNVSISKISNRKYVWVLIALLFWVTDAFILYEVNIYALAGAGLKLKALLKLLNLTDYALMVPLCAVNIFLFFSTLTINNKKINWIASTTFGIYLLHDNVIVRELLWNRILKTDIVQYKSTLFPLYALVDIIIVFVGGMIVDLIRQKYFVPIACRNWTWIKKKVDT